MEEREAAGAALLFVSHDVSLSQHFCRVLDLGKLNKSVRSDGVAC
jgi:hypothetical protein